MTREPTTSPSALRPEPTQNDHESNNSRPWTAAAAMEPVPPLAPPPARPGAGTPVLTTERPPATDSRIRVLVGLAAVALTLVVLVIMLLVGR